MNWEEEIKKITQWLKNYLEKSGAGGYVISLDGNLNSSIVLSLCHRAVDKNIIAVHLPCYSLQQQEVNSCELINNLGLFEQYAVIDLGDILDCFITAKNPIFNSQYQMPRSPFEIKNIKDRLRAVKIYELSNHYNYLVAGDIDKTNSLISNFSKFGDSSCCDISPLANFYKSELFGMSQYLPEIPRSIIEKEEIDKNLDFMLQTIDTLDNFPENKEQFLYEISRILGNSEIELNSDKWTKVYHLIKHSEHKRNMPVKYSRYGE